MLRVSEANAGQKALCPACGKLITTPTHQDRPRPPIVPEIAPDWRDEDRRGRYDRESSSPPSKGWNVWLIVGISAVGLLAVGGCLFGLLLPAGQTSQTAAALDEESNNLQEIGHGLEMFAILNGDRYPASAAHRTQKGAPGLSWRVAILPYIDQEALHQKFKLDEPWDSPHNKALLGKIPKVLLRPGQQPTPEGLTHYLGVAGSGSIFGPKNAVGEESGPGAADPFLGMVEAAVTDGKSSTAIVVVAATPVPWTKPDDFDYTAGPIGPRLNKQLNGTNILFASGNTKLLPPSTSEQTLRAYMTANAGDNPR
jgi:hypothetical protein